MEETITDNANKLALGGTMAAGGPIAKPTRIILLKNKEKAPKLGSRFGQDVEPSWYYAIKKEANIFDNNDNYEIVMVEYEKPLIIPVDSDSLVSWKYDLSKKEKAKGKSLSKKLIRQGYDIIITRYQNGDTGEIIVLDTNKIKVLSKEDILAGGGTIAEQVEEKLLKQQVNKDFKDIGRVAHTRKEKSAYKLISGSILSTLEEDGVMAYNMVKKENVWPEINIQEEKDRGVSAGATYLKVKLREAAPTRPKDEKAKRATYVLFLELFQKDLKECYTVDQIKSLIERYTRMPIDEVIGYFIDPNYLTVDENSKKEIRDKLNQNHRFNATSFYGSNALVSKLINEIFGAKFENALLRKSDSGKMLWAEAKQKEPITPEESAAAILALQDRKVKFVAANEDLKEKYKNKTISELKNAMETDWSLHGDSKKIYKAEPERFREWVIQYYDRRIRNEVAVWAEKEKNLQPKGNDWSWTDVKEKTESGKEKAESINTKAPLSYIKRTGGYKVEANTPAEIVDKFGFSAVNYGVYVDDTWSKEHTKHFLGAMSDLGDILNIDIKAFNDLGKLSIAFGAKGRRGHMATYFPQTKDINLTRGNGDGSLAHEWGHYFDNVIVELSEKLAKNSFASDGSSRDYEIKSLFQELMTFIYKGDPALTPKLPTTFYAKPTHTAPMYSARVNGNYETKTVDIKPTIEETLEQLDNFAVIDKGIYHTQLRLFGYVIAQFRLESYEVPMRLKTSYYFHKSAYGMFRYCYQSPNGIDTFVIVRTKYWTSAVELFARAWETVVLKKLMDNDRMSNYLVSNIPMEDIISETYNRPYPSGLELARIEVLIEKIIEAVKAKYKLPGFTPPSEIKEDEYLDLSGNGKVAAGVVVEENNETGEKDIDFVEPVISEADKIAEWKDAIPILEMLIEDGDGSSEQIAEWKEAIEVLKMLVGDEPESVKRDGDVNGLNISDKVFIVRDGKKVSAVIKNRFELPNGEFTYDLRRLTGNGNYVLGAKGKLGTVDAHEIAVQ